MLISRNFFFLGFMVSPEVKLYNRLKRFSGEPTTCQTSLQILRRDVQQVGSTFETSGCFKAA